MLLHGNSERIIGHANSYYLVKATEGTRPVFLSSARQYAIYFIKISNADIFLRNSQMFVLERVPHQIGRYEVYPLDISIENAFE